LKLVVEQVNVPEAGLIAGAAGAVLLTLTSCEVVAVHPEAFVTVTV
jgi:hypothetical protein